MSLINCEINPILTWSANCVISNAAANQAIKLAITDTKLYIPDVTLLTQDNAKLLQQLKSRFKRTVNWNKHQSKIATQNAPKQYLDCLIDSIFRGVNRLFVAAFKANNSRIGHSRYYLPIEKVEDYNVMINGKNVFDQPIKNYIKTYENN